VQAQLVHQALQDGDVPRLPSFPADPDLSFTKRDLLGRKLREERNPHPGLQERPEHQPLPRALLVSGREEPVDLLSRHAVYASTLSLRGRETDRFSGLGNEML